MLREWDGLPIRMKNDAVKPYYNILAKKRGTLFWKRVMDFVIASILLILLSPIMLVIAASIKAEDHGPVFFRQERVTTYGRKFRIFKFRTMIVDADKRGPLVTGRSDARITKTGSRLRKLRLDEIPQLLNILSGDMSFVGTRPEVEKYVECYTDEMWATLLLPAGLTSSASIEFRDEDEIIAHYTERGETTDEAYVRHILPKKMKYNLEYLKKAGVIGDLATMVKTVLEVVR